MGEREQVQVVWQEEKEELTLEGEPVLRWALSCPQVTGAGLGGRWISRYYARLAACWKRRWQREVYWKACLELARCRAASRPFTPWKGELKGEVALWKDGLLSLRMEGWETQGDGRVNRVRWGDVWKVKEGAPCPLKELICGGRKKKQKLLSAMIRQGRSRLETGECVLDRDWEQKLSRFFPKDGYCLTPEGLEFAYPQCSLAPAAEGIPVFQIPLEPEGERGNKGKNRRRREKKKNFS